MKREDGRVKGEMHSLGMAARGCGLSSWFW